MAIRDIRMNILSNATIAISKGCKSMRGPAIFSVLSSPANWSGAIVDILSRVNTERFPLSLRGLPVSFVFKLAQELAPSNIANRLGEGTVLHHIFNR